MGLSGTPKIKEIGLWLGIAGVPNLFLGMLRSVYLSLASQHVSTNFLTTNKRQKGTKIRIGAVNHIEPTHKFKFPEPSV